MDCEYCDKKLSSKSALKTHQQKTKYCLKIQGKSTVDGDFSCKYCNKKFTVKVNRNDHHKICPENNPTINKLKDYISKLENKNKTIKNNYSNKILVLEKEVQILKEDKDKIQKIYYETMQTLAKKPTYSTKNYTKNITTNNLSVFDKSPAEIEDCVQNNYTEYHLRNGQKGVAWFTHDHITSHLPEEKPKYLISDKSRGHGVYKENETDLVQDTYMGNLTSKIYPSIKRKATIIAQDSNGDIFSDKQLLDGWHDTQKMEEDNTGFCKEYVKKSALITK